MLLQPAVLCGICCTKGRRTPRVGIQAIGSRNSKWHTQNEASKTTQNDDFIKCMLISMTIWLLEIPFSDMK